MSEHEHTQEEEEAQEAEEVKDLDVPEEESQDVKGGATSPDGRRNIN